MSDKTFIKGKDAALEDSIASMLEKLEALNIDIEEASWLNPVPNVYSVHIRDRDCALMAVTPTINCSRDIKNFTLPNSSTGNKNKPPGC